MIHSLLFATFLAFAGTQSAASESTLPRTAETLVATNAATAGTASNPPKRKATIKRSPAQVDSLLRIDSLAIDSLQRTMAQLDSLVRLRDSLLARSRDSVARLKAANDQADSLHVSDTLRHRKLLDSIALFHRLDTHSLHIDTFEISDSDLSSDSARLRDLIILAASASGYNIVDHQLVPNVVNSQPLRIRLRRTNDSVWLKLDLGGKVAKDSIHLRHANSPLVRDANAIPRMERDAVRELFGKTSIPPEPKGPWHWAARLSIVTSVALAAVLAMVCLQ